MGELIQDLVSKYADPRCKECGGTGWIDWRDQKGHLFAEYCSCYKRGRQVKALGDSGLAGIDRYTLAKFETPQEWQQQLKRKAEDFILEPKQKWFFVGGQPGAGKTHICTAICIELINQGTRTKYEIWPSLAARLKTYRNEVDYTREMGAIKEAPALYIDDLFKGKITEADKQIAWEIINARYAADKTTIISSELHTGTIAKVDEAISGRILQMAAGYISNLKDDPQRDHRSATA